MAMPLVQLQSILDNSFPGGEVLITDLAGDDDHYLAFIRAPQFFGKSVVQQHKMVYDALNGMAELHALSLKTEALKTEVSE